jgi:predicted amidophosphoribosyltransferase
MQCPQCQHDSSASARFCELCGGELAQNCPACGHAVSARARFCESCGQAVQHTTSQRPEDLDPEEARRIVAPALQLMMEAVHRYDGYIVQSTGAGLLSAGDRAAAWVFPHCPRG